MDDILKYFKNRWIGFALTFFSIILVSFLHWVGVFDIIEMKMENVKQNFTKTQMCQNPT